RIPPDPLRRPAHDAQVPVLRDWRIDTQPTVGRPGPFHRAWLVQTDLRNPHISQREALTVVALIGYVLEAEQDLGACKRCQVDLLVDPVCAAGARPALTVLVGRGLVRDSVLSRQHLPRLATVARCAE